MPRYIDIDTEIEKMKNAVIERKRDDTDDEFTNRIFDVFINALNKAPIADVVDVVRCKDCIHRDPEDKKCDGIFCAKNGLFPMDDNDYCSYGDRKELSK